MSDDIKKYEELYNFSLKIYNDEIDRFRKLDDKASKYFSAYSLIIAVLGIMFKIILADIVKYKYSTVPLVFYCITFIFIIIGWIFTLLVLKTENIAKIPLNMSVIDFFKNNKLVDIYYAFPKRLMEGFNYNLKISNKKSCYLGWSYRFALASVISITFLFFSVVIIETNSYNNKKEKILWQMKKTIKTRYKDKIKIKTQILDQQ